MRQPYNDLKTQLTSGSLTGAKLTNFLDSTYCQMIPVSAIPTNDFAPLTEATAIVVNGVSGDHGKIYRRSAVSNQSASSSSDWEYIGMFLSGGTLSDHNGLTGRDAVDSHPISAITGLQTALDGKLSKTFTSLQTLTYTGESAFRFYGAGQWEVEYLQNNTNVLLTSGENISIRNSSGYTGELRFANITASHNWTLPNATGTIALASQIPDVSGYLPKTFASQQDLVWTGSSKFSLASSGWFRAYHIDGSGNNVAYSFMSASDRSISMANENDGWHDGRLRFGNLTASRDWQLPNASGTIALVGDLGSYIARNGATTTTATIPFAAGISITGTNADSSALRIPDGSWIRPQTAGQSLYITRGTNPGLTNGAILLETGAIVLQHGNGTHALSRAEFGDAYLQLTSQGPGTGNLDYLSLGNNNVQLRADNGAGLDVGATQTALLATGGTAIQLNGGSSIVYNSTSGNHIWDNGISGATTKYQFGGGDSAINGKHYLYAGTTSVGWLGFDSGALNLVSVGTALTLNSADILNYSAVGNHKWDSGISGSTAKYQFNGTARFAGQVDFDGNVNVGGITTTAGATIGGNITVGGTIGVSGAINLSGNNLQNVGQIQFNNNTASYVTSITRPILYATDSSGGAYPFLEAGNLIISPRISGAGRDVIISSLGTKADFTVDRNGNTILLGRLDTTASTTTTAGLRIPHGTAPTSPVNGDVWTTTTSFLYRLNGATKTSSTLEDTQTYSGAKTFTSTSGVVGRAFRTTQQTNAPTGTTYSWAMGSGQALGLTLTSSTGATTVTITGATADAASELYVTGHGSATRDLSITASGVTFHMTGKTSGATILLDTIPINGQAYYKFQWRSATVCYITRMALV
jgi:hypothetical protein